MSRKVQAYLGLGANIGNPIVQLRQAVDLLNRKAGIYVSKISSVYETAPVGYLDQPNFYNLVVEVQTTLMAHELLQVVQQVEKCLHRVRKIRYGPRTMDVDILLYDQRVIQMEDLQIPHPRMRERSFVIIPLAEIVENPDQFFFPDTDQTLGVLLRSLGKPDGIKQLGSLDDLVKNLK